MPNDITIELDGHQISHRSPGPWKVETFKSGCACVTNANGINWISGLGGQTLFDPELAAEVAAKLNDAADNLRRKAGAV